MSADVNFMRIIPLSSDKWTEQEKWVWECVRNGENADFNSYKNGVGLLDPLVKSGWDEKKTFFRVLRSDFLATILAEEPFKKSIHRNGIQIIGAWFNEPLDLINLTTDSSLCLHRCLFEREVDLSAFHSSMSLSFCGSRLKDRLILGGLNVKSSLFLQDNAQFDGDINLNYAKLGTALEMTGSIFRGKVDMNGIVVDGKASLDNATFQGEVDLRTATIGTLSMIKGNFKQKVDLGGAKVSGSIYMHSGAIFESELDLRGAVIGKQLDMTASMFKGRLVMNGVKVAGTLFMRGTPETQVGYKTRFGGMKVAGIGPNHPACFDGEVDLTGAEIGNQLSLDAAFFESKVNLNGTKIAGLLRMVGGIYKDDVILASATIGGQVAIADSIFEQKINMNGIKVADEIIILNIYPPIKEINCAFASIGRNLDISNSSLCLFDLTGSMIRGELSLSTGEHGSATWISVDGVLPRFVLRNVSVNSLQDRENSWLNNNGEPIEIELSGFVYKYLGGFKDNKSISTHSRSANWFIRWLSQQKDMSPQPYEQLAKVLNESGHKNKAKEILFAGKERQRISAIRVLERIKLEIEYRLVGYGFRIQYAFGWCLLFYVLGILCFLNGNDCDTGYVDAIIFSGSKLLPVLKLGVEDPSHLAPWAQLYFFFHGVVGYVLSIFIVAGLTGFLRKLS